MGDFEAIFAAQAATEEEYPGIVVDFRLVNSREHNPWNRDAILPGDAKRVPLA